MRGKQLKIVQNRGDSGSLILVLNELCGIVRYLLKGKNKGKARRYM